jgi:hypothetical protein
LKEVPAGTGSLTITFCASTDPTFETATVKLTVLPRRTDAGPVLKIDSVVIGVELLEELLEDGIGLELLEEELAGGIHHAPITGISPSFGLPKPRSKSELPPVLVFRRK